MCLGDPFRFRPILPPALCIMSFSVMPAPLCRHESHLPKICLAPKKQKGSKVRFVLKSFSHCIKFATKRRPLKITSLMTLFSHFLSFFSMNESLRSFHLSAHFSPRCGTFPPAFFVSGHFSRLFPSRRHPARYRFSRVRTISSYRSPQAVSRPASRSERQGDSQVFQMEA